MDRHLPYEMTVQIGLVELVHARKFSFQDTNKQSCDLCILASLTFELQIFKLVDSVVYVWRERHDSNSYQLYVTCGSLTLSSYIGIETWVYCGVPAFRQHGCRYYGLWIWALVWDFQ